MTWNVCRLWELTLHRKYLLNISEHFKRFLLNHPPSQLTKFVNKFFVNSQFSPPSPRMFCFSFLRTWSASVFWKLKFNFNVWFVAFCLIFWRNDFLEIYLIFLENLLTLIIELWENLFYIRLSMIVFSFVSKPVFIAAITAYISFQNWFRTRSKILDPIVKISISKTNYFSL